MKSEEIQNIMLSGKVLHDTVHKRYMIINRMQAHNEGFATQIVYCSFIKEPMRKAIYTQEFLLGLIRQGEIQILERADV